MEKERRRKIYLYFQLFLVIATGLVFVIDCVGISKIFSDYAGSSSLELVPDPVWWSVSSCVVVGLTHILGDAILASADRSIVLSLGS